MSTLNSDESDNEDYFDWNEYMKYTKSQPAPAECFKQSIQPPVNEFKIGDKVETIDPRNATSWCIGTIIEKCGPRLRLRLDGTDDRNDFWKLVDSADIRSYGSTVKLGQSIVPPLGFQQNSTRWLKYFEKHVEMGPFASETCFISEPPSPKTNFFEVGQKLEAVDQKNPHLICPATVRELLTGNQMRISLDGWSNQNDFRISCYSRDIFPCGWCAKVGCKLTEPGSNVYKNDLQSKLFKDNKKSSPPSLIPTVQVTPVVQDPELSSNHKDETDIIPNSNSLKSSLPSVMSITNGEKVKKHHHRHHKHHHHHREPKHVKNLTSSSDDSLLTKQTLTTDDHFINGKNMTDDHNNIIDKNQHSALIQNGTITETDLKTVTAYLNCSGDNGGMLMNPQKLRTLLPSKFGPDEPSKVLKLILDSCYRCAFQSSSYIDLILNMTPITLQKSKIEMNNGKIVNIPELKTSNDFWDILKTFLNTIQAGSDLFVRNLLPPVLEQSNHYQSENQNGTSNSPTYFQPSNSIPDSLLLANTSSIDNKNKLNGDINKKKDKTLKAKRSSSKDRSVYDSLVNETSHHQQQPKTSTPIVQNGSSLLTANSRTRQWSPQLSQGRTIQINHYSVEDVANFIRRIDASFEPLALRFTQEEIDGKALLLLNTDTLMKHLGLKLGPALKIIHHIDTLKK
ncbi:unnamed protein product [Didymodactylos carnosus]|uniref:SAM domain-containing protein n=1 Tax=Didymodactylos carnosus TaxID=1234261 RepID=A0A813TKY3_9BILA|nr:unnamed protein product [Didymodactylos carnosus]CAF3596869.1 unnamed protein product [Didymodactylos carnosus]